MFGDNYIVILPLIVTSAIIGFLFLTTNFVINRRNPEEWKEINILEKIILSFFVGVVLLFFGLFTGMLLYLPDNIQSTYVAAALALISIPFYSFFVLKLIKKKGKKRDVLNDIPLALKEISKDLLILLFIDGLYVASQEGIINSGLTKGHYTPVVSALFITITFFIFLKFYNSLEIKKKKEGKIKNI